MIREKNSFLVLIFRIKEMGGLSDYISLLLLRHSKDSKEEKLVGSYVYSFVLECITCCKFDDDISCLMLLKFIHFKLRLNMLLYLGFWIVMFKHHLHIHIQICSFLKLVKIVKRILALFNSHKRSQGNKPYSHE